jgi:hypothetical protein
VSGGFTCFVLSDVSLDNIEVIKVKITLSPSTL